VLPGIGYYLLLFVTRAFALLPLSFLYLVSNVLYYILFYLTAYRRNVVFENLEHAFPDKTKSERLKISRLFYRHFADLVVEDIKMIGMSRKQVAKRMKFLNPEIFKEYRDKGRSLVVTGAHYANWEWTLGIVQYLNYKTIGVYKPLNNKIFDRLVVKSRDKFGCEMVGMREIVRHILKHRKNNIPTFNVFIMDQSPVWEEIQYWLKFMGQLTPVYLGPEKLAKQFDMAVLYGKVEKISRGMYSIEFVPVEDNPVESPEFEITEKIFSILEKQILANPEFWLWSHRRWKHTRKREEEEKKGIFRFNSENIRI
jgi:KDO2-lipid IV(A) lauroyltransferase